MVWMFLMGDLDLLTSRVRLIILLDKLSHLR